MFKKLTQRLLFCLSLSFVLSLNAYSQDTTKTTVPSEPVVVPSPDPTNQDPAKNEKEYMGVAVSPSTLRFNVKPGNAQTKTVKITNDSKSTKKFDISLEEYVADEFGKPVSAKKGSNKYGLSKWLNITPSYAELKSGEQKIISIQLEVPNIDTAAIAGWAILTINEVRDKTPLEGAGDNKTALSLGIFPGIGFGVYIYQNPPNVNNLNVEITGFTYQEKDKKRTILLKCKNIGDGIGFCNQYIDLLNLTTGEQRKIAPVAFTILPGFNREFTIDLPVLTPGKYSAAGVIDFGSKEYVQTAELEFTIE